MWVKVGAWRKPPNGRVLCAKVQPAGQGACGTLRALNPGGTNPGNSGAL